MKRCPLCKTEKGDYHESDCELAECAECKIQCIQCKCSASIIRPFNGMYPGEEGALEKGWWCRLVNGLWVPCNEKDPQAKIDHCRYTNYVLHRRDDYYSKLIKSKNNKSKINPIGETSRPV